MNELMLRQKTHIGVLGKHREEPENKFKKKKKKKAVGKCNSISRAKTTAHPEMNVQ